MVLRTASTAVDRFREALDSAEANLARITRKQDEQYESTVAAAEQTLRLATALRDEAVRTAETKRAADRTAEQGRHDALVKRATDEYDQAMRERYNAPDAAVVTAKAGGSLELRSGRQRLGGVVQVGTDSYRVDGLPGGFVFLPDAVSARRLLWSTLQPDEEPAVA